MSLETKMIIVINGCKIEISEEELIELRDRLNEFTNYSPCINYPPIDNPYQEPYNPWITPNPNIPWYGNPIIYC